MDHGDGQECAPGGEPSCGDPSLCTQTRGAQAQLAPHGLGGQGGRDQKGVGATIQHRVVTGPNEVARLGHRRHAVTTYDYVGLHLSGRRTPWRSAVQVRNE